MLTKQELIQRLLEIKQLCFYIEEDEAKQIENIVEDLLSKIRNVKLNQLKRLVHAERKKYPIGTAENLLFHNLYEKLKNVQPDDTERIDRLYKEYLSLVKGVKESEKANN
ncbi:hypothetical protein [Caldicellulosiruptor bescii]|uniref:Uncharacterized protein n=2 Tax=Caldicellulosiruptor bescii TaxID=31899 RepID=B9MSB2_CALBD|nr:hypothetical protein [Caldicellulosiruptor bescii]ACM61831.1 hypothetical protein Athe_2779 [Caldicellulosiruptor bescii DSM 6725]PBC87119.1 hypothetical protein B0S87_2873 [Caldicellulosiruptor bescii]PBD02486.1 hypothetical protein B0S85_2834 [Caldicellulosiruptor bescii]PFH12784.1 hypothetical protein B0S88_2874 [Caldicellulosiruptor bescii]SKC67461.1 hypothetical protein SAMN05216292_2898 [Caldicellulosiruptor bescii]